VLAVVAHPDDESFGLGAVLDAFVSAGATTSVVCFTAGEASTLHGVPGPLHQLRANELGAAARVLGLSAATLLHYPDGNLREQCRTTLAGEVLAATRAAPLDGMVAFDLSGVTGHPDHAAATAAAVAAADILGVPVLGWTLPLAVATALNREWGAAFVGSPADDIDYLVTVDRARQRRAIAAHASQAVGTSVVWRRLALLGSHEYLRLLRPAVRNQTAGMSVLDTGGGI
jgi:LmbE family N-acetylglucosaminyl deacetylase